MANTIKLKFEMKKIKLFAVATAMLLSCGVFVKSMSAKNNVDSVMATEVLALTECTVEASCGCGYYVQCSGRECSAEYDWVLCDKKYTYCSQMQPSWVYKAC